MFELSGAVKVVYTEDSMHPEQYLCLNGVIFYEKGVKSVLIDFFLNYHRIQA